MVTVTNRTIEGSLLVLEGMVDPVRLMEEMNSGRIAVGPRGVIGLIDATALTSDARIMANVMSLAIKNGAILRYGSLQSSLNQIPRSSSTSKSFAFGNQEQRLESLPPVPDDDRASEVSQAVIFSGVFASCIGINIFGGLFGLEDLTFWTNLVLGVAITLSSVGSTSTIIWHISKISDTYVIMEINII